MATEETAEFTTVSEKGQVVIPQKIRKNLNIKPRSTLQVFSKGGFIIMKEVTLPDIKKEWEEIFRIIDSKNVKITEQEILDEIQAYRREKRERRKK